jgi:RNA polymerase sigma-70 factor, ECF subfamily
MDQEIDLLRRAREGDPSAGEELFVKYLQESRSVNGLLRRALPNPHEREEMLHEIYLQLISGQNSFRGEARLSTYVYQVSRITILQKYRRENTLKRGKIYRTISEPYDIADGIKSNPEYTYSLKEARQILSDLIGRLPEAYRETLRLRVLEDLSYEQIAAKMQMPLNTVSTKIHKGKKLLASILKEKGLAEVFDF